MIDGPFGSVAGKSQPEQDTPERSEFAPEAAAQNTTEIANQQLGAR
ncbi:MAG: hypothetical protein M3334_12625 [Actinomycetota bacterium]|nr:hypothetical protein [Actinomycetota bacterium]